MDLIKMYNSYKYLTQFHMQWIFNETQWICAVWAPSQKEITYVYSHNK